MIALAHGGGAPSFLPRCCKHRRCKVDGKREPESRPGPALGKISFSPPAFPTKHHRHNPAHLNLFSWGLGRSVDRRRCHVSCSHGDKTRRLSRMPCPPQEKGLFCLLFVAVWTKSKASAGRDPRSCLVFDLGNNPNQNRKTKFAGPGRQPGDFLCSPKESNQRKGVRPANALWHSRGNVLISNC